ncbi:MAG: calcium-binding protein [Actinomycetes bacterium]
MLARSVRPLIALFAASALAAVAVVTQVPAQAAAGASVKYERWATITKTSQGYYYDAGQQDSHLVITRVAGGVQFADTNTDVLRVKPAACTSKSAQAGIVVVCRVPATVDARHPMTLEIFTRLGDDYIDSSTLSAAFQLSLRCDKGAEVVHAGAGDDFVNGAHGRDLIWGGGGNDWIRSGVGNDVIRGGAGSDLLTGDDGRDSVHGGTGQDRVGGGNGDDHLFPGVGTNFVNCGTGSDNAYAQRADRVMQNCESVVYG